MTRKDWDTYFMELAQAASERSTCPRLHVGAVVVDQSHRVLATGYNGSLPGEAHCADIGCLMVNGSCKRTIHGEINAIRQLPRSKKAGSTIYINYVPCRQCAQKLAFSGVIEIVYGEDYKGYAATLRSFFDYHGIIFRQHEINNTPIESISTT